MQKAGKRIMNEKHHKSEFWLVAVTGVLAVVVMLSLNNINASGYVTKNEVITQGTLLPDLVISGLDVQKTGKDGWFTVSYTITNEGNAIAEGNHYLWIRPKGTSKKYQQRNSRAGNKNRGYAGAIFDWQYA